MVLLAVCALFAADLAPAQTGWSVPQAVQTLQAAARPAPGDFPGSGFVEAFEGPNPSWAAPGADANLRVVEQRRVRDAAHSGQGCEWLRLHGEGNGVLSLGHEAGRPRVIEELRPSVWVKSDRAGLHLVAEIALPRSLDSQTGRALVAQVHGTSYNAVGQWQQLHVADVPRLLTRQVHILRSQLKTGIDARDAYLRRVLLNIYGGPGPTDVWIDDLAVTGFVKSDPITTPGPEAKAVPTPKTGPSPQQKSPPRTVELSGAVLLVRNRPVLPRVIQYQGEPLSVLKQLGFNAIWLRQTPSRELLEESQRTGLWLVCPPPDVGQAAGRPDPEGAQVAGPATTIGPEFGPVLAWDLGSGLTAGHLEATRLLAQSVRLADASQQRPLICSPMHNLLGYSRYVDLLLIDRRPLGTSLEMPDYGAWVRRQPLLARPGTPAWTTVQTQPNEALRRQLVALEPRRALPGSVGPEQIRLLVYTAISCGSRGLVFQSQSRLDAQDIETRQRASGLQFLNLELELIEPWVAAGSFAATSETSQPEVIGAVLRSDRARLVLPSWSARGSQCVAPSAAVESLGLIVPGVPESASAYELTAGRLQPLRGKRVTGGMRLTLDEFRLTGLVLLAQDPLVIDAVTRRAGQNARLIAELERQLAAQRLQSVSSLVEQLSHRAPPKFAAAQHLAVARQNLQRCDAQLAAGDLRSAAALARRVTPPLRLVERAYWEAALVGESAVASPATVSFATLPWHWDLMDRVAVGRFGSNLLPGGDFEDLDTMLQRGWRHCQYTPPRVHAAADLVAEAAHSGSRGLRLTARCVDPEHPPAMLETSPVWITSPALPVEAGQLVRIHGWAYVPAAITGSVDGLMIIDSLTGEDMAERIDKSGNWREFTLYRAVQQSGAMTVTFLLSGLGEARLDDVTVQVTDPARSGTYRMQPTTGNL